MTDTTHVQRSCNPQRGWRRIAPECTRWASDPGEPPATVTIIWGVDAHDTTTIDLTGELCGRTAAHISALIAHVAQHSPANVAIDASAVTFLDSRGLALLLSLQNQLAERAVRCRIVSPSRVVRRLFELARVEDRLCGRLEFARVPNATSPNAPSPARP
jgi:anti-anti-sigma factor